jgi:hypothetical protein
MDLKKNPYGGHGKAPKLAAPTSAQPANLWATVDIDPMIHCFVDVG